MRKIEETFEFLFHAPNIKWGLKLFNPYQPLGIMQCNTGLVSLQFLILCIVTSGLWGFKTFSLLAHKSLAKQDRADSMPAEARNFSRALYVLGGGERSRC